MGSKSNNYILKFPIHTTATVLEWLIFTSKVFILLILIAVVRRSNFSELSTSAKDILGDLTLIFKKDARAHCGRLTVDRRNLEVKYIVK